MLAGSSPFNPCSSEFLYKNETIVASDGLVLI